jgi:hypothetical protein
MARVLENEKIFQNKSRRFVEIRNAQQSFILVNKLLFTIQMYSINFASNKAVP